VLNLLLRNRDQVSLPSNATLILINELVEIEDGKSRLGTGKSLTDVGWVRPPPTNATVVAAASAMSSSDASSARKQQLVIRAGVAVSWPSEADALKNAITDG
jgi:hypothetical protein